MGGGALLLSNGVDENKFLLFWPRSFLWLSFQTKSKTDTSCKSHRTGHVLHPVKKICVKDSIRDFE